MTCTRGPPRQRASQEEAEPGQEQPGRRHRERVRNLPPEQPTAVRPSLVPRHLQSGPQRLEPAARRCVDHRGAVRGRGGAGSPAPALDLDHLGGVPQQPVTPLDLDDAVAGRSRPELPGDADGLDLAGRDQGPYVAPRRARSPATGMAMMTTSQPTMRVWRIRSQRRSERVQSWEQRGERGASATAGSGGCCPVGALTGSPYSPPESELLRVRRHSRRPPSLPDGPCAI